ncbi:MAG: glutathione S-transferase family protein [Pseudomonadota bacterium]
MITIVSFSICPFVQRVTALLEAKGLAYTVSYINLSDPPPWFSELSPTGQVPLLVTEAGEALFESDAIVEYLDEIAPPLVAGLSPVQRAQDRAWSTQASKHYLPQCSAMQSADRAVLTEREAPLHAAFDRAEAAIGDGPYFRGNTLGNVDIAWLPLLHRAARVEAHSGHDLLQGHPKVKAWQHALADTGLFEASVSADFNADFDGFYLSERTYLGRGADPTEACAPRPAQPTSVCCG